MISVHMWNAPSVSWTCSPCSSLNEKAITGSALGSLLFNSFCLSGCDGACTWKIRSSGWRSTSTSSTFFFISGNWNCEPFHIWNFHFQCLWGVNILQNHRGTRYKMNALEGGWHWWIQRQWKTLGLQGTQSRSHHLLLVVLRENLYQISIFTRMVLGKIYTKQNCNYNSKST